MSKRKKVEIVEESDEESEYSASGSHHVVLCNLFGREWRGREEIRQFGDVSHYFSNLLTGRPIGAHFRCQLGASM